MKRRPNDLGQRKYGPNIRFTDRPLELCPPLADDRRYGDRDSVEGVGAEPAVGGCRLRGADDGLTMGLRHQYPGLGRNGNNRNVAAIIPFRDTLRSLHGLSHAAAQPDQGRVRQAWGE